MSGAVNQAAAAFASNWGAAAQSAGQQLGVAPAVVLSQWALESGYGTSSAAQAGNLAGIQTGGVNRTYSDAASFVSDYVNTIRSYFPGAQNTGDNADAFVQGLTAASAGGSGVLGSYFGSQTPSSYEAGLLGAASTLANSTPSNAGLGSVFGTGAGGMFQGSNLGTAPAGPLVPVGATSTGTDPATPSCGGGVSGLGGIFTWACWAAIMADAGLVLLGFGLIIVGVTAGVKGGPAVVLMPGGGR